MKGNDSILDKIEKVPDFPKEGILFYDLMPTFNDAITFQKLIKKMAEPIKPLNFNKIVGLEARGFIVGAALANKLNYGFVPIRKKGKLPKEVIASKPYNLEYGTDIVEIQKDSLSKNDKVLIVDDVLATGNTALTALELVKCTGCNIAGILFVIEIESLKGRDLIKSFDESLPIFSLFLF